jgi:hypothetical protein
LEITRELDPESLEGPFQLEVTSKLRAKKILEIIRHDKTEV